MVDCDKKLLAHVLQQRCEVLGEIPAQLPFIDAVQPHTLDLYTSKKMKTSPESSKEALTALIPVLEALPEADWTLEKIHDACFDLIAKMQVKNGWMLLPMRDRAVRDAVHPRRRHPRSRRFWARRRASPG